MLEVVDRRRGDDRVVEAERRGTASRSRTTGWSCDCVGHVRRRVEDADELDALEPGEHAGVVAAHHAEAEDSGAQRHQAPAFATALTASTMVSSSPCGERRVDGQREHLRVAHAR